MTFHPSMDPSLQILGLMVVRKLLDLMFSQHDLAWLDDILPDKDKKKKEDEKKKKKEKKAVEPESDEEVRESCGVHGECSLSAIRSFFCLFWYNGVLVVAVALQFVFSD